MLWTPDRDSVPKTNGKWKIAYSDGTEGAVVFQEFCNGSSVYYAYHVRGHSYFKVPGTGIPYVPIERVHEIVRGYCTERKIQIL